MATEFAGLDLECVPPDLVPLGPSGTLGHRSCLFPGNTLDSTVVNGAKYVETSYSYSIACFWRNITRSFSA